MLVDAATVVKAPVDGVVAPRVPFSVAPVIVGPVDCTTAPAPVVEPKSEKPNSQAVASLTDVEIQVTAAVACDFTVATNAPVEEFIVRLPLVLLTILKVHPGVRVDVFGSVIVWDNIPVKT
jgi:hypothetical protein